MYKVCECGRVCETKQSYCSHHGKCKVANPEGAAKSRAALLGRKMPSSWNKGLTKETDVRVRDMAIKVSQSMSSTRDLSKVRESAKLRDPEMYRRQSETRLKKFASGELTPPEGAGRGKYSRIVVGDKTYTLRSTYEFLVALYLNLNGIDFEYESVRVKNLFEDEYPYAKTFLSDFSYGDTVIEVKGHYSSKVKFCKESFEKAGYRYEVFGPKEIDSIKDFLKSHEVDVDCLVDKIYEGHRTKEYFVYVI